MKKISTICSMLLSSISICAFSSAVHSAENFNDNVSKVSRSFDNKEFARLLIYRGTSHSYAPTRPAFIYYNNQKIGAISKDEYVELCVPCGPNLISSHLESALIYSDKNKKDYISTYGPNKTYFLRINDDLSGSSGIIHKERNPYFYSEVDGKTKKEVKYIEGAQRCQVSTQIGYINNQEQQASSVQY